MLPGAHVRALWRIATLLEDADAAWALTGSTALALQGLPMEPRDVDVQTNESGAYEIGRRLAAYVLRPVALSATERIRSHFGLFEIEGVQVEVMGDVELCLPDGSWRPPPDVAALRRWVEAERLRLPVLDLAHEEQAYRALGRVERADAIRAWLRRGEEAARSGDPLGVDGPFE